MSYGSYPHSSYAQGIAGLGSTGIGASGIYKASPASLRIPTSHRESGSPSRISPSRFLPLSSSYSSASIPGSGLYSPRSRSPITPSSLSPTSSLLNRSHDMTRSSLAPVPPYSQYATSSAGGLKTLTPSYKSRISGRSSPSKPRYGLSTSKSASSLSPNQPTSEVPERQRNRYGSSSSLQEGRATDRSRTASLNSSTSSLNEEAEKDYKKLYLDMKDENERLKKKLGKVEIELDTSKQDLQRLQRNMRNSLNDGDKRERRALERKLSELEEEVKELEKVQADNQRLRDENGALIRVISKLSK